MTIRNALNFIKRGANDEALRNRLLEACGKEALTTELAKENLVFSHDDFEEAYSLSLFKCQRGEEAESLMDFRMWWTILVKSNESPIEYSK